MVPFLTQERVEQSSNFVPVSRVYKGVKLVDDDCLDVGEEQLVALAPVLHAIKCRYDAIKPSFQLCRLNFVVLARPESTET